MADLPFVTIILPIRNESGHVAKGLGAILAQDYPIDCMEILIVDGMSTDATRNILSQIVSTHPRHKIRILDNPGKIVPTGLNIALRQAKGEIIIRVDGHCQIVPDYVRKCVQYIRDQQVDGVGGPMHSIGEGYISELIAIAMSSKFGVGIPLSNGVRIN